MHPYSLMRVQRLTASDTPDLSKIQVIHCYSYYTPRRVWGGGGSCHMSTYMHKYRPTDRIEKRTLCLSFKQEATKLLMYCKPADM